MEELDISTSGQYGGGDTLFVEVKYVENEQIAIDLMNRIKHGLKLVDLMEQQIKIEDDFMYAKTDQLKGTYSASIRRGILEKLYKEASW